MEIKCRVSLGLPVAVGKGLATRDWLGINTTSYIELILNVLAAYYMTLHVGDCVFVLPFCHTEKYKVV